MKRWVLGMSTRDDFCPKGSCPAGFEVRRVVAVCPELNRVLHTVVGKQWHWGGRHDWGEQEWAAYADRPELETWIAYLDGKPAGYYELEHQEDGSIRIQCFGLMLDHIGQGLGGSFISHAVDRCWELDVPRIWLNTCSRDHPNALRNYLKRGFQILSERESED